MNARNLPSALLAAAALLAPHAAMGFETGLAQQEPSSQAAKARSTQAIYRCGPQRTEFTDRVCADGDTLPPHAPAPGLEQAREARLRTADDQALADHLHRLNQGPRPAQGQGRVRSRGVAHAPVVIDRPPSAVGASPSGLRTARHETSTPARYPSRSAP